jgi:hypothetical protein
VAAAREILTVTAAESWVIKIELADVPGAVAAIIIFIVRVEIGLKNYGLTLRPLASSV